MSETRDNSSAGAHPGTGLGIAGLYRAWSLVVSGDGDLQTVHDRATELAETARDESQPRVAELGVMVGLLCEPVLNGDEAITDEFCSTVDNYLAALDQAQGDAETESTTLDAGSTVAGRLCVLASAGDPSIRELWWQLEHFGYQVDVVEDTRALVDSIQEKPPLAVVLDHDGLPDDEALSRIPEAVREATGDRLPMLVLSSAGDIAHRLRAARAGIEAYLVKPVRTHDLMDRLEYFAPAKPPEPLNILLVEDSRTQATYFASLLEQAGMRVTTVADPMVVLDVLQEQDVDLILMDMYMPHCNGHELARVVRQVPRYASIPIVYLSAETQVDRQLDAMSRGGDDFLVKPIEPAHLIRSVTIRAERARTLRSMMVTDNLTGLLNHTRIKEELDNEINRTQRRGGKLAFVMLDIDHFKTVNDTHGHPVGDTVIRSLSRLLQQRLRRSDAIGRYGGEEFAIVMPDATGEQAASTLERIRRSFNSLQHEGRNGTFHVSFSAGVADFPKHDTMDSLTVAADAALYRAKEYGRNRVILGS
ncbi:MAG: diguanylate cyclase [Ectothiorhodospiraceae bacterium]